MSAQRDPCAKASFHSRARGKEERGARLGPHLGLEEEQEVPSLYSISHHFGAHRGTPKGFYPVISG